MHYLDVGGQDKIRPLWRHYFQNTQVCIFENYSVILILNVYDFSRGSFLSLIVTIVSVLVKHEKS